MALTGVQLDPGVGGSIVATDLINTYHYQISKLVYGAIGSQTVVTESTPYPVKVEGFDAENAAVANNPVLAGGRYDGTPRTLGDGDLGALAVDASGYLLIKPVANSGVDIGDVDVTSLPSDTFVTEGGALGKGVLLQGDDGTDRTNVLVDADGHLQIDALSMPVLPEGDNNIGNVDIASALPTGSNNIGDVGVASMPSDTFVAEDGALGKGILLQGDDGTDRHNVLVDTSGHLQIDVLTTPALSEGSNNIGDVDVASMPSDTFVAENGTLGKGVLIQGDDGTDRLNVQVDSGGVLKVCPTSPAAGTYLPVRISDGSAFSGFAISGWDQSTRAVQRGLVMGATAATDQTLLAADGSNLYNVMEVLVCIFVGTASIPSTQTYISLYHGPSASGTEFARVYAELTANKPVHVPIKFSEPDRGAVNQAVVAKLNQSLGTNGEFSVTVHAYKTSS